MKRVISLVLVGFATAAFSGCARQAEDDAAGQQKSRTTAARPAEPATGAKKAAGRQPKPITTEEELQAALKETNPRFDGQVGVGGDGQRILAVEIHDAGIEDISSLAGLPLMALDLARCHVTDISPLEGMPLRELYLEETGVRDISALAGMPLVKLYLSNTKVEDLSPLKDAKRLQELNLVGTQVSDLGPLEKTPLEMLWVTGCPVRDVGPLKNVPLVSVTLEKTKVADLSPLGSHKTLQRLHIAGAEVTDLSALSSLRLTRLIFTPGRIKTGMEHARQMETLREIGTDFEGRMPPDRFWSGYDAGEIK